MSTSCRRCLGSPPRAWGRPDRGGMRRRNGRFTPTCVGTATTLLASTTTRTVHPHVRGDGPQRRGVYVRPLGSPPRAWGRRPQPLPRLRAVRFTPTCVGTAIWGARAHRWTPVHPHVRGDGGIRSGHAKEVTGSPPRAWGRRPRGGVLERAVRFTPTCVGTASSRRAAF